MNRLKLRYLIVPALSAVVVAACSSAATDPVDPDGGFVPVDASGIQDSAVAKDSGKDSASAQDSGKDASFQTDSSTTDSSTRDGASEGGSDAGADSGVPSTGTACTTVGFIYTKKCGLCGTQEAACENDMKVGAYGICNGEVVGGCMPGDTRVSDCGLCGKKSEICQNNCQWASGTCSGEPAGACAPGTTKYTTAGCTVPDTFRKQVCGLTCQYGAPEPPPCKPKDVDLSIGTAVAAVTSGTYEISAATDTLQILYTESPYDVAKACPLELDTGNSPYAYVTIKNPNAKAAKVDVWLDRIPAGSNYDTIMAVYTTKPTTPAQRLACTGFTNDDCDDTDTNAPCAASGTGSTLWSALWGTSAVSIPANGSVVVYVAKSGGSFSGGEKFLVKTKVKSLL